MKQVWKWIMHLNAKAFCVIAVLLFCATVGWCVYQLNTPLEPIKEGTGKLPDPPEPWEIGIINFVNEQLAGDDLSIPITPFGWTMEAILADPVARTNLLAALNAARNPTPPAGAAAGAGKGSGNAAALGGRGGAAAANPDTGPKMITPKISFLGFFKRSDGSSVAMFSDSSDNSTVFYSKGKTVHGIEILGADMKEAQVKYPDGSVETIPIGGSIELAPEPEKTPAPAAAAAAPKAKG